MDYREALTDGRESSEFLTCACCSERVNDDGSDISGTIRQLTPPRRKFSDDIGLTRKRERAWCRFNNERERAWRFCYWEKNGVKFPLSTRKHPRRFCNIDRFIRRERDLGWAGDDFPLPSMDTNTGDLGAVISTQEVEVGGSSPAASSSNMPIICQYCRAIAAAFEIDFNTKETLVRLSMPNDYQWPRGAVSPLWHLIPNHNTNAHPYVSLEDQRLEPPQDHEPDQDSAQELGGSSSNEAPSSSYHPPPPSQSV